MPEVLLTDLEMEGIRDDVVQIFEDFCTIDRLTGYSAPHPTTAVVTPTYNVLYANTPCFLAPLLSRRDDVDEIGGAQVFQRQYRLAVQWHIDNVQIRDRITMTISRDPQLVGREFVVKDVVLGSNNAYRRFTLIDFEE